MNFLKSFNDLTINDRFIFGCISTSFFYFNFEFSHKVWEKYQLLDNDNSLYLQDRKVAVYNHCMSQGNLFQTQKIAYTPLAKNSLEIRISNQENENSKKFPFIS